MKFFRSLQKLSFVQTLWTDRKDEDDDDCDENDDDDDDDNNDDDDETDDDCENFEGWRVTSKSKPNIWWMNVWNSSQTVPLSNS